ncbi:MAG: ATP-binding protein [Sphingomicrobium sp.]
MRTIGTRLTTYYAVAATVSAALLFLAGYLLLEDRLIHGLDQLNRAEYQQLRTRLGADYATLGPAVIDQRIHETAEAGSALFFINVDEPNSGMIFYSLNLHRQAIPDVKGSQTYLATMPRIGELRVSEFVMKPFDVTIATPTAQVREGMRSYVVVCALLLLVMLLVSVLLGRRLSKVILKPLNFIRETASRIGSDNLSERIPVADHDDELSDLALLLNRMFDRLEVAFEQIKRFSADASHELKTPLSLIRLHAEKLLNDGTLTPAAIDAVVVQLGEVARLNQIIEEMLFLSRAEAGAVQLQLVAQDPSAMLASFEQDAIALAEHRGCRFAMMSSGTGTVSFDERLLRQLWLNLLTNALNVSPPGGLVAMSSRLEDRAWTVEICDDGPGLEPHQLNQMFDRFKQFGTHSANEQGTGLGLAICRSIVDLHGGRIAVSRRSDGLGLRVAVTLDHTPIDEGGS